MRFRLNQRPHGLVSFLPLSFARPSPSKRGSCLFSFSSPSFYARPAYSRTNYSHSLAPLSFHHRRFHPLKCSPTPSPSSPPSSPSSRSRPRRPPPTPTSPPTSATSGSCTIAATLSTNIPMSPKRSSRPGQMPAMQTPKSSSRRASRSAAKPAGLAVPHTPHLLHTTTWLPPRLCRLLLTSSPHRPAPPGLTTRLLPLTLLPPLPSRPL